MKFNDNSKLEINEVISKYKDKEGRIYIKTKWRTVNNPISLGSMAKPNNKIKEIRITVPEERRNPFDMLFGNG